MMFTVPKRFLDEGFSIPFPLDPVKQELYDEQQAELQALRQAEYQQTRTATPSGNRVGHLIEPSPTTHKLFTVLSDTDLNSLPDLEWQIDGVWQPSSLIQLYGRSGIGKSFLALDFAGCVATGLPWKGHAVKHQGPVFYVSAEGGRPALKARMVAWKLENGISLETPIGVFTIPQAINFAEPNQREVEKLIRTIEATLRGGQAPALIVLDTLARSFGAANENDTAAMNTFIKQCDRIKEEFDSGVLVVHHTGKKKGSVERGSSAFRAAVDTSLLLDGATGGIIKLTCDKQKNDEDGHIANMILTPISGTNACVFRTPGTSAASGASVQLSREQIACLRALFDQEANSLSTTEWEKVSGVSHNTFYRWIREVFTAQGLVEKVDPADRRSPYRLTPKGAALFDTTSE